jgi:hypothetical protein
MDRNELTLAVAGALLAAFLLGWTLRWAFARMNATGPRNAVRTARLAAQLHAAEEAQHAAERRLADQAAEAQRQRAELLVELDAARAALARAEAQAEEVRAAYRKALGDRPPG